MESSILITTEERWSLVGGNIDGVKPFGVNEKMGGAAVKL
jgi:hypothetical protein